MTMSEGTDSEVLECQISQIVRCEITSLIPSEMEASQWVISPFLLETNLNSNSALKKVEKIAQSSSSDYSY